MSEIYQHTMHNIREIKLKRQDLLTECSSTNNNNNNNNNCFLWIITVGSPDCHYLISEVDNLQMLPQYYILSITSQCPMFQGSPLYLFRFCRWFQRLWVCGREGSGARTQSPQRCWRGLQSCYMCSCTCTQASRNCTTPFMTSSR